MTAAALPFVLSIKPTYVERILSGRKTIELRRRFPSLREPDQLALIYCTSPVQAIIGCATLRAVETMSTVSLWRRRGRQAAITREEFQAYFAGTREGCALVLRHIIRFNNPIHLTDLSRRFDFYPPQSYCYWKTPLDELTTHGWVKASARYKHSNRA
jgi:predicted transcriptional regulator